MVQLLKCLSISLAATLLVANGGEGKSQRTSEDQDICVTIASFWTGNRDDIRRIREEPIPESYRRRFEGGGCARFQLVEMSLVSWHLLFGDEQSTSQALAYIEADYRKGSPAPGALAASLPQIWEGARKLAAEAPPPREATERAKWVKEMATNPAVLRARSAFPA